MPVKYYATRFWLSLSLSFFLLTPYLQRYNSEFNRFIFHWNRYDLLALLLAVILLGAGKYLCFIMLHVRGNRSAQKIFSLIFILTVELIIFSNLYHLLTKVLIELFPATTRTYWMIAPYCRYLLWTGLIAVFAYALFIDRVKVTKVCATLCLIASPVLPLFFINGLRFASIVPDIGSLDAATAPKHAAGKPGTNVYVFIFDEWSYQRTFRERDLLAEMPHLNTLKNSSFVFHRAFAPSSDTFSSVPSLLFQTDRSFKYVRGIMGFVDQDFHPVNPEESIFYYPRTLGFFTSIVGYYIPYGDLLHGVVDYGESTSDFKLLGEGLFAVTAYHLTEGVLMFIKPFAGIAYNTITGYLYNKSHVKLIHDTHRLCTKIIREQSRPTVALFHYMLPHFPFVFDRNGHKELFAVYAWNQENYRGNLLYLDRIIGEITDTLKAAGKYDASLLIMTSDHSWRRDPDFAHSTSLLEKCHVPLFIKLPFQKRQVEVDTKFETYQLGNFIKRYLDDDFDLTEAERLVREEGSFKPHSLEAETDNKPGK